MHVSLQKRAKKSHFYGHLVRSNVPLKLLKIYVLWRCFLKNEKRSNRGFFISKKYRKRFFRLFNYKRSLFFELPGLDKLLAQNAPKFLTWQR